MSQHGAAPAPRVAVVGCGQWGRNLVRVLSRLGALAAVCDQRAETAKAAGAEHGVPVVTFDEVLGDDTIDALALAVPAAQHAELAAKALAAGRHVFVEKPLALTVADAEVVCAQAEASGCTLMVGHLLQYHPAFRALAGLVADGEIGRVQYLYSNRLNLGRIRREEDILWSFAPHDVSMILSIVGTEPDGVWAVGARYLHKSLADVTTTHLSFPGGERAHVFVSWLHPFKEQKLVVVGDQGMAVFDDGEPWALKLQLYRHQIRWRHGVPEPVKASPEPVPVGEDEPLDVELRHFLDCVATGRTARTDGREGLRVLKVLERAGRDLAGDGVRPAPAIAGQGGRPVGAELGSDGVFVHQSAIVDHGSVVGTGTRIWHFSHVLPGCQIGRDCILGQNVMVGPHVTVGDGCRIQNNVSVYEGVTLADGVFCGPSCVFTNVANPRAAVSRKAEFTTTYVGRGATIGANATIVCGNRIGEYALIGAGAVVTSDVLAHALMVGVPARRIGWVSHEGERLGEDLVCPRSGRRYSETADGLQELSP